MAARRGARASTRAVHSIEEQTLLLPDPLALDTSFLVEALIASQRLHEPCRAFVDRIIESGVRVVMNELLEVELAEAVFAIALKERWGRQWRRHRADGRSRRRARRLLHETSERYASFRSSVHHVSAPVGSVATDAAELMLDYGLASYDAVHAATAIAAGAEAIVTTDTGFALLPPALLSIYTDRSRVGACRRVRQR